MKPEDINFQDQLKLERYRLVTDRQKFFTELARDCFASYMKIFTGLSAGSIALISARDRLQIDVTLLQKLIKYIAILVTFIGVLAIVQIIFCLIRWYGFRNAEMEINKECPKKEWWAWIFEGMYLLAILFSLVVVWLGSTSLIQITQGMNTK